jgi:hypothetical protein
MDFIRRPDIPVPAKEEWGGDAEDWTGDAAAPAAVVAPAAATAIAAPAAASFQVNRVPA